MKMWVPQKKETCPKLDPEKKFKQRSLFQNYRQQVKEGVGLAL
jgi:hypothetical protein